MSIINFLFGRPLASSEESAEQIGAAQGVPIFGLDALGSAAYGPEAALTLLIPFGLLGLHYILPLTAGITFLLIVVYFSYRQTIAAYPQGGGSYTVARENLGTFPGVLAGAALLTDYALDAAVGISAGIGALTSAMPLLHAHTLELCLGALLLLTIVNLRGNRETGAVFMVPTYLFLACMMTQIGIGVAKALFSGGHPAAVIQPPSVTPTIAAISAWILIKSFASGCTALTGVEAVSNGVQAFRDPTVKYAHQTLTIIIVALGLMLCGIAYLVKAYGIVAVDPNSPQYQSVLSMVFSAVAGRGWFYYVSIASVLLVLIFSANTAFAGFPRVCQALAEDSFLPLSFANRGRRLVYSEGIIVLTLITAAVLITFGGITDRLIPLFAVGAFLAFTLSQAGMVFHWMREGGSHSVQNMAVNGIGALATGIAVLIIIVAKFADGAWLTAIAIPAMIVLMYSVRRHYAQVHREIRASSGLDVSRIAPPIVVVAMHEWNLVTQQALQFALLISKDVRVVHAIEDTGKNDFAKEWQTLITEPAEKAQLPVPKLISIKSPYRFVISPIVTFIVNLAAENAHCRVVAVIPELIHRHWFDYFLHTQRASLLKARLLMAGNDRISVLNVPWYLKST